MPGIRLAHRTVLTPRQPSVLVSKCKFSRRMCFASSSKKYFKLLSYPTTVGTHRALVCRPHVDACVGLRPSMCMVNDNDNDNDTLREVQHLSDEGMALQARV